ncbi:type II toxin-antitoxin system RelE/ParE family toxin [uncultured Thiodictyon sp.]|jgi:plasmid stabilization system protein ParE|uniref:type II toxin-antitoxin system RelE/ParE family toxin n=1 Tax=uncultured Thiodictyon sp. TaxID=1846217 RepID=UPI0025DC1D7A|nr:type II toxin-antitoxin system RelE/ParE family toxin [uncultured Thiodictyon sp.]
MKVEYHPRTVSDLNDAVAYYNKQRDGLGAEFRSEIYAAIARVSANPFQYAMVEGGIRRCFAHRFPYSVLFRLVNEEEIRILVIRHHRRHPSFGLDRR